MLVFIWVEPHYIVWKFSFLAVCLCIIKKSLQVTMHMHAESWTMFTHLLQCPSWVAATLAQLKCYAFSIHACVKLLQVRTQETSQAAHTQLLQSQITNNLYYSSKFVVKLSLYIVYRVTSPYYNFLDWTNGCIIMCINAQAVRCRPEWCTKKCMA